MGIERSGTSGEHSEASAAVETTPSSGGGAGDGAAINQRVAGGYDGSGKTVEAIGKAAVGSEVGVVPIDSESSSILETGSSTMEGPSGGPGVDSIADVPVAYPSDKAEARAQYWHLQGGQYRNYEGTCGLASSAEMMSDQSGRSISEAEVVRHAAENGLCTTEAETLNPQELGGTTPQILAVLHSDYGLDSRVEAGKNQADMASAVDRGDGVVAAVNCADYWPDEAFESPQSREAHRNSEQHNHAVWVTGVSRSPEGEVTGFYLNDTGIPDGASRFVDSNDWARAWQERGGVMVTARRPE